MLCKITTKATTASLDRYLPACVQQEITRIAGALDQVYGESCDDHQTGGVVILFETEEDVSQLQRMVDYTRHPPEISYYIGTDHSYMLASFVMNNDYVIDTIMPTAIAPAKLLEECEESENH